MDFRSLGLPGHDRCASELLHMSSVRHLLSPEESKLALRQITSKRVIPLSAISFNEINPRRGLFSWELDVTGSRTYFLMEYKNIFRFFNFFGGTPGSPPELHLYEVIAENRPCHLYFDCEFLKEDHPDFNGPVLIEKLIRRVGERLFEVFGHDESEFEVVDLDATTEKKFSRHLIIRSSQFCFENNIHVGQFVQREIMVVPELAAIVDLAVYSRNRNFRCIWSTKCAKLGSPLVPADGSNSSPVGSSAEVFRRTLICDVGEKPHKIGYPDIECAKKATERLVRRPERPVGRAGHASDVEDFAIRTFAEGGWIVRRKFNEELGALNLIVEGTRFCRRIGREHRSNHVYIVCRLDLGLMMQKCTDPDCRGFQSEPVDIPEEMLEDLRREYAPGQAFSSQRVKVFGLEKVDIASIIAECEREMVCVS